MYYYIVPILSALLLGETSALTGPHVCHRVVNYTVTSREQYEEPVEILTLEWCMQIPPRCPQTRTELRQRWRMKSVVKYKSVPECCDGYVVQELVGNAGSGEAKCVPKCERCPASRGTCSAPNECTCDPGYQGQDCSYAECPAGSWGKNCENSCNCLNELACNPRSGKCDCPPGYTGSRCERKCPEGQWGFGCSSICLCENSQSTCHHETGECPPSGATTPSQPIDPYEASGNLVPSRSSDFVDVIEFDTKDSILIDRTYESVTAPVPSLPDDMIPVHASSTTRSHHHHHHAVTTSTTEGSQLLQPETKKQPEDYETNNFRVIVSPKTEYVKTSLKGSAADLSSSDRAIDVAAMIVVGALVSIGLTSLAAIVIFHLRSRLLKAALSIYNQDKLERQYAAETNDLVVNSQKGAQLDFTIGTLPRGTMTRVNPMYANSMGEVGPATIAMDDRSVPITAAEYANGTVTIGIRLSSNLRDLLESHYDRPAATTMQHPEDHVYDEIPLAAPFNLNGGANKYAT